MILHRNHVFANRQEISVLLGGDKQQGIAKSKKTPTILLFTNADGLYIDYFFPKGSHDFCMYTGIGTSGHQDSIDNTMYSLNMAVLTHAADNRHLLLFEKVRTSYCFVGEYQLIETHQNVQPDDKGALRRVFVFHLKKISDSYDCSIPLDSSVR